MIPPGSPSKNRGKKTWRRSDKGMLILALITLSALLGVALLIARSSSRDDQSRLNLEKDKVASTKAKDGATPSIKAASADLTTKTFSKRIITAGSGPQPQHEQWVTVDADLYLSDPDAPDGLGIAIWSTHLKDGFLFPASDPPDRFTYQAGVGSVVKGWEDGVASMKAGETARLLLPWEFAYGANGHPGFKIPPESDLVFIITIIKISNER